MIKLFAGVPDKFTQWQKRNIKLSLSCLNKRIAHSTLNILK